jgi:tetratricopeptide (TPR) repeat protein
MLMVVVLVLGQSTGVAVSPGVPTACQAVWARAGNAWERAKRPELLQYCDIVGSARAKLGAGHGAARAALDVAREAEQVLPERADAFVLEGRALAALGDGPQAVGAFRSAVARDPRALDDPAARLAWARALVRTGQPKEASEAYRSLQPWIRELRSVDRESAEIEAGIAAMTRGRAGLDAAVSSLRAATREGGDDLHAVALLALALALDRRGDVAGAREALASRPMGDPRDRIQTAQAKALFLIAPSDALAASALALEAGGERVGARDAWQAAIEADPDGPWADYAKAHAEADRAARRK